jgi:hypothetical protein
LPVENSQIPPPIGQVRLVGGRTRIVNRIKATLARLGIRNFKPTLRQAAERLSTVHTSEDMPLPPDALAKLERDMARLGFVVSQIREIEQARQKRLERQPETGPMPWFGGWPGSSVLASRRLICWFMRCCHGQCVTAEPWPDSASRLRSRWSCREARRAASSREMHAAQDQVALGAHPQLLLTAQSRCPLRNSDGRAQLWI